jgi:hypothetical protein
MDASSSTTVINAGPDFRAPLTSILGFTELLETSLDDSLEVLHVLWTEQSADLDLPSLRFEHIHMMPKPVSPDGVPIWISGTLNATTVNVFSAACGTRASLHTWT